MKDKNNLLKYFEKIKTISEDNDSGYERNWELYNIYKALKLNSARFLNASYFELSKKIEHIISNENKKYYMNQVSYNYELI